MVKYIVIVIIVIFTLKVISIKQNNVKFFFFSLAILCHNIGFAQQFNAFTPVESKNTLSENAVRGINQLPDGRMVIVTDGMVNIYNGASFQYVHLDAQKIYPLSGYSGFTHTYVESNGRFWIKNNGKLMLINMFTEQFEEHTDSVFASMGVSEPLSDFFMDSDKNLWMLTRSGRLLYRNNKQKTTRTFLKGVATTTGSNLLYDIAVLNNQVFLFYKSGLMVCYNLQSGKEVYRDNSLAGQLPSAYSRTLFVLPVNNNIYMLRNGSKGLMLAYNTKSRPWSTILKTDYWLNYLSIDTKGNILLSCKMGLWVFSPDLQKRQFIPTLRMADGRSIDTEVSTIYNDLQGGLWVGTLNRGLLYYHPDRFRFKNIGKTFFSALPNQDLAVTCFVQDGSGKILTGTTKGLFYSLPGIEKLVPFSGQFSKIQCNALLKDSAKHLWLCTPNGLYFIEGDKIKHYPVGNVTSITQASKNIFYLCTANGLLQFNSATGGTQKINVTSIKGQQISSASQVIVWKDNLLGISDKGLFIYNVIDETSVLSKAGDDTAAMLRHNNQQYNCLFTDSRGLLWFGTQDGLNVWNEGTKQLQSFHNAEGLVNNTIKSVIEDPDNTMWVTTANGVSHVKVKQQEGKYSYEFNNFNTYDGVIGNEFIERSSYITQNGHLLLGGIDGYNELDLTHSPINSKKLKPVFTSFQLFGKEITQNEVHQGNRILTNAIAVTNKITLKHNQNFFSIGFSALNFVNPSQTYYQYFLDGVDSRWQNTNAADGIARATYTNLSPGTYTFKVRAADSNRQWIGPITTLQITINAPWFKTPFALVLYVALFFGLVFIAFRTYYSRLKNKQLRAQQEELNQLKMSFVTNMSHELRTPLTLILTPLDVLLKKVDDTQLKPQLTGIYHNALNLLGLVNQLLDFRRLESGEENLHLSYCDIGDYIGQLCQPFTEAANSKEIAFNCQFKFENLWLYVDKDKLAKIINNLLSNAFKFTPKGGTINLTAENIFFAENGEPAIAITVADTGYGIAKKDISQIFNRFYQADNQVQGNTGSGIGLHLVKEYMQVHKGYVEVESEVGKGSVFSLYLPANLQPEGFKDETPAYTTNKPGQLKILIVEDNREFREFMANHLSSLYTIITAVNGKEGLDKVFKEMPDIIISDIMMPEMSGVEMCLELKKDIRISHIPVLLLTARSSDEAELEGYKAGADAYIAKPFNMDILLLRVHNLIEQQELRKTLFKKAIVVQPETVTVTDIDEKLIQKALLCVEKNISDTTYSVEQFSKDMNMDRTGLYRKLVATVGQTPSDFIRSIRLKNAARLLLQREHTITEIATLVGFNNAAYFSKCFQDEYGTKPSQYYKWVNTK